MRLGHGDFNLVPDMFGEFIGVDEAIAAGIDQFNEAVADFKGDGNSIARDAGHVLDDADAFADQGVEQTALSDVGTADNRDLWKLGHVRIVGGLGPFCNFQAGNLAKRWRRAAREDRYLIHDVAFVAAILLPCACRIISPSPSRANRVARRTR